MNKEMKKIWTCPFLHKARCDLLNKIYGQLFCLETLPACQMIDIKGSFIITILKVVKGTVNGKWKGV